MDKIRSPFYSHSRSARRRKVVVGGVCVILGLVALVVFAMVRTHQTSTSSSPTNNIDATRLAPIDTVDPLPGKAESASLAPVATEGMPVEAWRSRPFAVIHTDHGDITWELLPEDAPKTVKNFVRMSREGVFNSSCFYRYEKGFVLQGGLHCNRPPPHHGKAKNVPLEYKRRNEKYTVALARAGGDLNSGGTEFFINLRDNSNTLGPGKKGGYAVFANVVDGMDTIAALKKLPTKAGGLTRFVSPQPTILFIEIRNYGASFADEAIEGGKEENAAVKGGVRAGKKAVHSSS